MIYIFFRGEDWFPIEFENDDEAKAYAECNPGTTRVEAPRGREIWRASDDCKK